MGPPTPRTPLDGKVQGLNVPVFERVRAIHAAQGVATNEEAADLLIQAIRVDGEVDDAEWDLLDELCNSRTRVITITCAADSDAAPESVSLTSVGGLTRQRLAAAIPVLDLEKAWADGTDGWAAINAEHPRGGAKRRPPAARSSAKPSPSSTSMTTASCPTFSTRGSNSRRSTSRAHRLFTDITGARLQVIPPRNSSVPSCLRGLSAFLVVRPLAPRSSSNGITPQTPRSHPPP